MNNLKLQDIYIYPIKSLGGISVRKAEVQQAGLQFDRRWMLTDKSNNFISQRTYSQLALLQVNLTSNNLIITHKHQLLTPLIIPFNKKEQREVTVSIWDDVCTAVEVSSIANEWFSDVLKTHVQLVYMPNATKRFVRGDYENNKEIVNFSDAYPFMIIGQSSFDDLNHRLKHPILMNRFRPNFVFRGGTAYLEDDMQKFCIGDITFTVVNSCSRCLVTTIDQEQAIKGTEPLKTLATYRKWKNNVMFGQNLIHTGTGILKVGDKLVVQEWKK